MYSYNKDFQQLQHAPQSGMSFQNTGNPRLIHNFQDLTMQSQNQLNNSIPYYGVQRPFVHQQRNYNLGPEYDSQALNAFFSNPTGGIYNPLQQTPMVQLQQHDYHLQPLAQQHQVQNFNHFQQPFLIQNEAPISSSIFNQCNQLGSQLAQVSLQVSGNMTIPPAALQNFSTTQVVEEQGHSDNQSLELFKEPPPINSFHEDSFEQNIETVGSTSAFSSLENDFKQAQQLGADLQIKNEKENM